MTESLWPKQRLIVESENALIAAYRQVYLDTYVFDENGNKRFFTDWTGAKIIFAARAFDHAFTKAQNYKFGTCIHDGGFDHERARRILWIAEVLAASAGTIQRYTQTKKDSRGRDKKDLLMLSLIRVMLLYLMTLESLTNHSVSLRLYLPTLAL